MSDFSEHKKKQLSRFEAQVRTHLQKFYLDQESCHTNTKYCTTETPETCKLKVKEVHHYHHTSSLAPLFVPTHHTTIINNNGPAKKEKEPETKKKDKSEISDGTKLALAVGAAATTVAMTYMLATDEAVKYYYENESADGEFENNLSYTFGLNHDAAHKTFERDLAAKLLHDFKTWRSLFSKRVGTKTATKFGIAVTTAVGVGAFVVGSATFGASAVVGAGLIGAIGVWKHHFNTKEQEKKMLVNILDQIAQLQALIDTPVQLPSFYPQQPVYPQPVYPTTTWGAGQ